MVQFDCPNTAFQTFADDEDDLDEENIYWFELRPNTLACYQYPRSNLEMFTVNLSGFIFRKNEKGVIELVSESHKNLEKLVLSCEDGTEGDFKAWKKSFAKVLANDEKVNLKVILWRYSSFD